MSAFWLNVIAIALLAVGHAAWLVAVINRIHALPWREWVLHRLRQSHDLLIVGGVLAFLWFEGLNGARLLLGGAWHELPPWLQVYLGWCGACTVVVAGIGLARQVTRPSSRQRLVRREQVDVEQAIGQPLRGEGPYAWMFHVPGNEALTCEFNELELALPGLPRELDGLAILHVSDLHFIGTVRRAYFEYVCQRAAEWPVDLVAFTGDLLDDARFLDWIPDTLGRFSAPLGCHAILGNHDWLLGDPSPTHQMLEGLGWTMLGGKCIHLDHRDMTIALAGTEVPWFGPPPVFDGDATTALRILLSHTPDHLPWARRQGVDLMLAGHNHGGQVKVPFYGPVYAPSRHGCRYAEGVFDAPPTVMHVSRGLAGRHPLRLGCPPEITRVVLRAEG